MIRTLGSTVFSATPPSYCIHLLSVAERMGVDLRNSSVRHVLVGGEPGGSLPGTRRIIEEGWGGATVADAGGSTSEMYPFQTSVGCEAGTGTHLITDEVYTEVVDRNDHNVAISVGERGAVIYTHLWRESQPMIRFAPGDETYLDDTPCVCGRTYPRMPEGVLGRLDDMLVIRGGANIYPSAIETALRDIPELGPEFRIHVHTEGALDEIEVHAEVSAGTHEAWQAVDDDRRAEAQAALVGRAEAVLRQRLGIRIVFEPLTPGTLEPTTFKARRVIDARGVRW